MSAIWNKFNTEANIKYFCSCRRKKYFYKQIEKPEILVFILYYLNFLNHSCEEGELYKLFVMVWDTLPKWFAL